MMTPKENMTMDEKVDLHHRNYVDPAVREPKKKNVREKGKGGVQQPSSIQLTCDPLALS